MTRLANLISGVLTCFALIALTACATPAAKAEPNFDTCLMTNMAAVVMLEDEIAKTEDFLTRARMTEEAYEAVQGELSDKRSAIDRLLKQRADLLRDDTLHPDEQMTRITQLMRAYSGGADAEIASAKASETDGLALAAKATLCAESLAK